MEKGRPVARPNQQGTSWPIDLVLTLNSEVHISKAMIDVRWSHQAIKCSIVANALQGEAEAENREWK